MSGRGAAPAGSASVAGRALVVGEALIDIVRTSDGTSDRAVRSSPGGSPANVAVGLARLGVTTELLTVLGADAHGDLLRAHLAAGGVGLRPSATAAATSTAEARLDAEGSAEYRFSIDWEPEEFSAGPVRLLHTGSLAMVVEPGAGVVLDALAAATRGTAAPRTATPGTAPLRTVAPRTVVTLDPNVRPSLGLSREHVRAQLERFAGHAQLVKLSDEDLAWTYPGASVREVAERLHRLGVQLVVVTRGGQGCTLAAPGWHSELSAPTATVVDTIGAGDSFMSGLLFALLASEGDEALRDGTVTRDSAEAWARIAMRCAALTVGRAGAQPPHLAELEAHSATL